MLARTSVPRIAGSLTLCSLALIACGCKEELGPEHFPTARVSGVIKEGDLPVPGGWVEFHPVNGTVGNQRSARIRPDGRFQADRVAVGENAVRLVNAPIQIPGSTRLFGAFTTPIRRRISESGAEALKIDLVDEAIRYQAAVARAQDRSPQASGTGGGP
jgi:hypothetical protein